MTKEKFTDMTERVINSVVNYPTNGDPLEGILELANAYIDLGAAATDEAAYEYHHGLGLFELFVGAYHYCSDYHGGQWGKEYEILCIIGQFYKPSRGRIEGDEDEDALLVYAALENAR